MLLSTALEPSTTTPSVAGPHHERVVRAQVSDRHPLLDGVAYDGDILRAEARQCPEGLARARLRAGLEVAAGEDEHRHGGGHLEVDLRLLPLVVRKEREGHRHARIACAAEEQGPQRPAEGGEHAEGDERVHRRGAVAQVDPGRPVEGPRTPDHHRGRQRQRGPLPVGELQRGDHRHEHDRDRQGDADEQPLPQRLDLEVRRGRVGERLDERRPGGVAGGLDRADRVVHADPVGQNDVRLLGCVVDGGGDARHPVELLLDAQGARGAGHAADLKIDLRRHASPH
jgi:hypothetical protein